jgi:hypothetical protein
MFQLEHSTPLLKRSFEKVERDTIMHKILNFSSSALTSYIMVLGGEAGPTHLNFEAGWLGECFHCSSEEKPLDAQMVSHEKSRVERQ